MVFLHNVFIDNIINKLLQRFQFFTITNQILI